MKFSIFVIKIYYYILTIFRIIKYNFSKTKRYKYLLIEILKSKPKKIMEIGVYNGRRAKEMIQAASIFNNDIYYYGFDLFEEFYELNNVLKNELSKKPDTKIQIKKKLSNLATVNLYKGDTKKTLQEFIKLEIFPDFFFIDGGHSVKTIENDWNYVSIIQKKNKVVIFDDFYDSENNFIKKFGCNNIIKKINEKRYFVQKLNTFDSFLDTEFNVHRKIYLIKVVKI